MGSDGRLESVKKRTLSVAHDRVGAPIGSGAQARAMSGCTIGLVLNRATRRFAALLVLAALVGGCTGGDSTPTPTDARPSPSPTTAPDPLEVYRAIAADIVKIRGLDAPARAEPQVIDAEQLRRNFEAEFDTSNPEAQILIAERMYKALGLLPEAGSLRDIYLDLQTSQVIGYYDPSVDELFIVSRSGSLGPLERVTYAHEFTHELQDRRFDLESLGLEEATDESDLALAILGLVEGDAVSVQTAWMTAHLSAGELAQIAAQAADPEMLAILARTPAILLETSLFPYQAGATFVNTLIAQGGYDALNAVYGNLPASTEQVIHPEKYLVGEAPVDVKLPGDLAARFGSSWTLDAQDTLGELQLRVWLREGGLAGDAARLAAQGWGGDRIALLAGPGGAGDVLVLITEWDSARDATEFGAAAESVVPGPGRGGTVVTVGRRVAIAIGDIGPQGAALEAILEALAAG